MRRATAYFVQSLLVCAVFIPTILFAQPKVLTEIFSNTDCKNCKSPDEAYEAFMKSNTSLGIVRITYHNDFPSTDDPFYVGSKIWVTARKSFYGATSDPAAFINGKAGNNLETLWESYSRSSGLSTPAIAIDVTHNGDSITIHAKNTTTPAGKVRFYVALTESNIIMDNTQSYGEPVSGHWDDIFRMMLPSKDGSAAFTANGSDEITVSFDPTVPDGSGQTWDPQNMHAVVFLQDDAGTTRKIEALGVASLAGSNAVKDVGHSSARLKLRANPVKSITQLGMALSEASTVRVVATDILGRSIRTLLDSNLPEGSSTLEVNPSWFSSGCYLLQLFVNGRIADQQKLIVE